jgi:hypothetical protein
VLDVSIKTREGTRRRVLLAGKMHDLETVLIGLEESSFVLSSTIMVDDVEYWDNDSAAGCLHRAALAYLASRQGGASTDSAARIPGHTNGATPCERDPGTHLR